MENLPYRISKVIFLVYWPVTSIEEKRWNFDHLRREGFEVIVFDLTYLLSRKGILEHPVRNNLHGKFIHQISTYRELDDLLGKHVDNSIFIDYIVGLSDIEPKFGKVFRLLKKHRARYTFIAAGALPLPSVVNNPVSALLSNARKAVNVIRLLNFIARKLICGLSRAGFLYPVPYLIFGVDYDALQRYALRRGIDVKKIVLTHSLDYDVYLNYQRDLDNSVVVKENVCVFLDNALVYHPDFHILGLTTVSGEEYFPSIRRLFDFIEKTTGLSIVIAAHPRVSYESIPNVFGDRPIIKYKTIELVAKSALVVTHYSSSISFAVLFKKPIIFAKTAGMRANAFLNKAVDTMAASLGVQPIEIDSSQPRASCLREHINLEKYDDYLYKYIKSPHVPDMLVWEIVSSTIKNLGSEVAPERPIS